ncbi:hypothetical protein HPB49_012615 [Dermacentor silvarum]|uniref:Uncharacterized protein n=1 Tax=Dermacentor silvarum TaxID=543639 RepID=A0ACB8C968_DERSI|nr:hypothetical protein HPB49_012615 [Dermacentor silvarum]
MPSGRATADGRHPKLYADILQQRRPNRRIDPPPHPRLSREEAVIYRQPQTNPFTNVTVLIRTHPTCYELKCKHRKVPNTLRHMVREYDGTCARTNRRALGGPVDQPLP